MTAAEPDPWDECARCLHDRDDHDGSRCNVIDLDTGPCRCTVFAEAA